jgi:hypothetical protein
VSARRQRRKTAVTFHGIVARNYSLGEASRLRRAAAPMGRPKAGAGDKALYGAVAAAGAGVIGHQVAKLHRQRSAARHSNPGGSGRTRQHRNRKGQFA